MPKDGRRILFLDDNQDRVLEFSESYSQVVYVTTPSECIANLLTGRFDKLYLDFDLTGDAKGTDYNDPTSGAEVVRWLEKLNVRGMFTKNLEVILQTHNVPMSNRMLDTLEKAGYRVKRRPFGLGGFWNA